MLLMVLMAVIIPIIFGLLHTIASVYMIYKKGRQYNLFFNIIIDILLEN